MELWQLTQIADPDDPRWQGRSGPRRVLVAARTAGEARMLAAQALARADRAVLANEAGPPAGVLDDEKLYRLDRRAPGETALPASSAVLEIEP